MSFLTRSAASSFSLLTLPRIFVLTGPAAGNVSLMVSAWNRIAASASTVEYTPQASSHGSVRSSYLKPSTSRPLTNVSAQSLRDTMSASNNSINSLASEFSLPSPMCSARLTSKSDSPPSSISASPMMISAPPSGSMLTTDSSSISISILSPKLSRPCGAEYKPLPIESAAAMICP